MSIIQSTAKSGTGGFYDFPIEQSLRFDGTSSYLSRTPTTAGNRKTWTFSCWIKRSRLNVYADTIFSAGTNITGSKSTTDIRIDASGDNYLYLDISGHGNIRNQGVLRDTSSWYHVLTTLDTTSPTFKFYINGNLENNTGSLSIGLNEEYLFNNNTSHYIGHMVRASYYFNGYLANIQFLDGTVPTTSNGGLDASTGELKWFGETKSGVWIPKAYTGSYGTNGFRLAFNLSDFNTSGSAVSDPYGSATNLPDGYVADASGSGNHWQVN